MKMNTRRTGKDHHSSTAPDIVTEELREVQIDLHDLSDEEEPFIKSSGIPPSKKPIQKQAATGKQKLIAVASYWVISLSLVFLNKFVMVGDITNLDAPLFMSWTQFVITAMCCALLGVVGRYVPPLSSFPPFEYKIAVAKQVMPLTVVFLGMIVFNNLCLKYVEVSFYQVARSLTIVFNIVFTYCLLSKKTNTKSILCCVVIVIGYLMGCDGEVRFDWNGVVYGLLSSIFVALNAIYVKKILPKLDDDSNKLMIYNNMNAVFLLPIIIVLFTDEVIEISVSHYAFSEMKFWGITIIAGMFGFAINFASYIQIKFTSPLTHNVSGTAKAAAQTVIAIYVFQNPITWMGIVGCAVVILASFAYSRVR